MQEIAAEKRELPTVITPEVFFVIEYGFSAYFQHNLNAIKQYIAIFFNSVSIIGIKVKICRGLLITGPKYSLIQI